MKKSAHRLILLIVLAIVTLLPMSTVHAANFTAGNSAELIVAINTANGNGEADTITLTADITLNAVDNSTTGDNGLPVITSDITIEGDGHTLTRDGSAPNFRFLYVDAAGDLTLNNVTISNGRSNVDGGAIYNNGGALTISRSTLDGNYTGDDGGAIYNNGGTVTIEYSTISNNEAPTSAGFSGALDNRVGGMMTISYSILSGNRAGNGGGAIYSDTNNPTLTIIGSTLDGNTADWGGGIQCSAGTCTISGSTFSNNTGTTSSGGGGLRVSTNGTAVVTNSTITGNTSANNGGGIYVAGVLTLRHVTLAGNSAPTGANLYRDSGSTVNVASSIIADPVSGGNCSGAITDNGGNLEAESSGSYTCPATFTQTTTSGLGALADNGGPTGTMALDTASLAVDGTGAACGGAPTNGLDQRGYPRDALCDIGAFEYYDRSISGWVWYDTDGDGIQDSGETTGVGGLDVTLNPGGTIATTDSAGYYEFAGLASGTYTLTFEAVTGYYYSLKDRGGDDTLDSDPAPVTRRTDDIILGAAPDNETSTDAGLVQGSATELIVTKSNSVGGTVEKGEPWDWTLYVSNTGSADADFNAGDVVLIDELPTGPTYPAAAIVTPNAGVTGSIVCTVTADVLTCTAMTPVTIDAVTPGSFEATLAGITSSVRGVHTNPTGTCEVDPNDVVAEQNELNNGCNVDTVTIPGGGGSRGDGDRGSSDSDEEAGTPSVVTITESAPEYIIKTVDNPSATGRDKVTYTITAHNPKDIPLTEVVIYDVFDDLLEDIYVESTSHGTFDLRGDTLTVSGFTLQPGETATIIVTAVVSDDYKAGDVIPNVAVLESPDASVHVSNLVLIGDIANRSDGDSASVMVMPGELPATGDEPVHQRGWIYASTGAVLLIAAGWIVRRRLVHQEKTG